MQANQESKLKQRLGELNQVMRENPDPMSSFDLLYEVNQGYMKRIDRTLASVMSSSNSWYLADLAYRAYAYPEELTATGAHLLCFRLPFGYKPPCAYTLTAFH